MWYQRVVGQKKMLDALLESVDQDTLSHAVIVEGASGYGGLPIVLALAQRILCATPTGSNSCGSCKNCIQVQGLAHPDLHLAFPVVKKEGLERKNTTSKTFMAEWREAVIANPYITYNDWIRSIARTSANGDINAKECNDIIQQLNFQAFSGNRKVQIIWISDRLGGNGNKLLKLIEEPPEGTFLILICDQIDALLKTIISRCRIIRLPTINEEDIVSALINRLEMEEAAAQQIAYICNGDFSQALEYAQIDQNNLMDTVLKWFKACEDFDLLGMRNWSIDFSRHNAEEQKAVLHYSLKVLQAIIYYQLLGQEAIKLSETDKGKLLVNKQLLAMTTDHISEVSDSVSRMIMLIERYVNSRMVMFNTCLSMGRMMRRSA